jgi:hypothetical protein
MFALAQGKKSKFMRICAVVIVVESDVGWMAAV